METIINQVRNESSVKITQNSKGYNFEVKVYSDSTEELQQEMDKYIKVAENTISSLKLKEELK